METEVDTLNNYKNFGSSKLSASDSGERGESPESV
jgi:hypothetical protein